MQKNSDRSQPSSMKDSSTSNGGGNTSQTPSRPAKQSSAIATGYLIFYNFTSLALWGTLTLRLCGFLILLVPEGDISTIYDELFPLLGFTQSLALLEVVHSLLRLVRASLVTTMMQVASRILVVWGVMYMFSAEAMGERGILGGGDRAFAERRSVQSRPGDWAFVGCLAAWGITECVRYGFFVLQLSGMGVPKWLLWLRYNTFFPLYPLGISCEGMLLYFAIPPAAIVHRALPWIFRAVLAIYVPGSYVLYTHMMAQRRKVLRAAKRTD